MVVRRSAFLRGFLFRSRFLLAAFLSSGGPSFRVLDWINSLAGSGHVLTSLRNAPAEADGGNPEHGKPERNFGLLLFHAGELATDALGSTQVRNCLFGFCLIRVDPR